MVRNISIINVILHECKIFFCLNNINFEVMSGNTKMGFIKKTRGTGIMSAYNVYLGLNI
jgi:hypothetical protein